MSKSKQRCGVVSDTVLPPHRCPALDCFGMVAPRRPTWKDGRREEIGIGDEQGPAWPAVPFLLSQMLNGERHANLFYSTLLIGMDDAPELSLVARS